MAWKATGQPTVRKQGDEWVVHVDGIDTATGKVRPRPLRSYASQRAANAAACDARETGRTKERGNRQLARASLRRREDRHHREGTPAVRVGDPAHRGGLGAIPIARLDRDDVPHGSMGSLQVGRRGGGASRSAATSCARRSPKRSTKNPHTVRPPASASLAPWRGRSRRRDAIVWDDAPVDR